MNNKQPKQPSYDLIIYISSSGPNVLFDNLKDTIQSIRSKVGNEYKFGFYFSVDKEETAEYINSLMLPNQLVGIQVNDWSWAKNFNTFFEIQGHRSEYIMISHDDLTIDTHNFLGKTKAEIQGIENTIGWITFTSDGYYMRDGIPMSNSVREGFSTDRGNYPYCFECHNFKQGDQVDFGKFDLPKKAVKVHAPFSHIMLIKSDNLRRLSKIEDWTKYTMLIEEDSGLEALKAGLFNIWVPGVKYTHPLRHSQKPQGNRFEEEAHKAFIKKWGFDCHFYDDRTIHKICCEYPNTNIPLTSGRTTFDYQYLR